MENKITMEDILSLHPSLDEEYYIILSESSSSFLHVYFNSDFGLEYSLYDEEYNEMDGGVIDECEAEEEEECTQIILDLLEEMNVRGTCISKMPEEDISSFDEKVQEVWEEKVRRQKELLMAGK